MIVGEVGEREGDRDCAQNPEPDLAIGGLVGVAVRAQTKVAVAAQVQVPPEQEISGVKHEPVESQKL